MFFFFKRFANLDPGQDKTLTEDGWMNELLAVLVCFLFSNTRYIAFSGVPEAFCVHTDRAELFLLLYPVITFVVIERLILFVFKLRICFVSLSFKPLIRNEFHNTFIKSVCVIETSE